MAAGGKSTGQIGIDTMPAMVPARPHPPLVRLHGIGLMILAGCCFGAMGALVKYSKRLPILELVFLRGLFGLVPLAAIVIGRGRRPRFRSVPFLLLRTVSGLGGMSCYFYAVVHLDLATASVLNKSSPVFVVLLAWLVLGERAGRLVGPLVALALVGCYLLIRPDLGAAASSPIPGLVGAGSAILSAIAYTTIRHLRRTDDPVDIVVFFMSVSVVLTCPGLLYTFLAPRPSEWLAMAVAGCVASAGQVLMTRAYRIERAAVVSPFIYSSVLFAAAGGFLFWGEVPTLWTAVGAGLVIAAGIGLTVLVATERGEVIAA